MILLNKFIAKYNFNNELYSLKDLPKYFICTYCMIGKKYEILLSDYYINDTFITYISEMNIIKPDKCGKSYPFIRRINILINPHNTDCKSQYKSIIVDTNTHVRYLFEMIHNNNIFTWRTF